MDRRVFLLSGIAGLIGTRVGAKNDARILTIDDPFLEDLRQETHTVGSVRDGRLHPEYSVRGWEMNIEEDDHTLFDFVVTNNGPNNIHLVHCQPYTFGPWQIIEKFFIEGRATPKEVKHSWRCCNDSNFFCLAIQTTGDTYVPMNVGNGSGSISSDTKVATLVWHQPQEVKVEIRGRKGEEKGSC